jgi:integrase
MSKTKTKLPSRAGKGKIRGTGEGGIWQIPADAKRHAGKWRCTVELGYKPDGTRIRRDVIAATKEEILRKLAAGHVVAAQETPIAPKDMTVAEFLNEWLDTLELAGKAARTIEQRQSMVRLYLIPELGRIKLRELSPIHVEKMLTRMSKPEYGQVRVARKNGTTRVLGGTRKTPDQLSGRTLQIVRGVLVTALTRAEKFEYVTRNAAKQATTPKSNAEKREAYTADEIELLLQTANGDRIGRVVELLVLTGLRRGELGALRWSNVDLEKGTITVDGTLGRNKKVGATKTKSSQGTISLPPRAVDVLRAQAAHQADDMTTGPPGFWVEQGFVFTTSSGGPLAGDNLGRYFTNLCTKAKVRCLGIHALRHTFATLALTAGVPLVVVSRTLRHASITITANQYAHVVPELQEQAVNAVAGSIAGWQ